MPMAVTTKWHSVRPEDRERIHCVKCGRPADVCEHQIWNTGNTSGISFWYYCHACAIVRSGVRSSWEPILS